jgi:hypothetical protein
MTAFDGNMGDACKVYCSANSSKTYAPKSIFVEAALRSHTVDDGQ